MKISGGIAMYDSGFSFIVLLSRENLMVMEISLQQRIFQFVVRHI